MIAVIQGCGNNLASVANALKKLSCPFIITNDRKAIAKADKIILPGVGAAGRAMHNLEKYQLIATLQAVQQPFLGICLGMQLLYEFSHENHVKGLGIIPGEIKRFNSVANFPVPHMGWNQLYHTDHPLFNEIDQQSDVYFVHSFFAEKSDYTIAKTHYLVEFTAAVQKNNFFGVQFHPEKSSVIGLTILKNFLSI
jgi:imidazole glycerol-phosphate synthase subunit HisH